jgi:hypothetical protein
MEILFWYDCEIWCCFLFNFFCGHKIMTIRPNLDLWNEPRVCMEHALENMVVEGWVEFGSLPKPDAVGDI